MKKRIINIILIIFFTFFGINEVNALTCVYEMYPINIGKSESCTDDSGHNIFCTHSWGDGKTNALIQIDINSKSDYTISEKKNFGRSTTDSFKDNNFVKNALKKGCPSYIRREKNAFDNNLKILNSPDFVKEMDKMYDTISSNKYVAVLVKQDEKVVTEGYETVIGYANSAWNNFASENDYKDPKYKNKYIELENGFVSGVESSSIYSTIKKSSTWTKYLEAKNNRAVTEAQENKLKNAKNDYCYLYCEKTYCAANANNSTAMSACKTSCDSTIKPKCDSAYNECSSADDIDECMSSTLTQKGLDSTYVDTRNKSLNEIQNNINEGRNNISTTGVNKLNLQYGTYTIKCSDVQDLHTYWVVIKILAPILVILFGSADFLISVVSGDEEKIKKARNKFPKRLIAALLIFVSVTIISILVSISSNADVKNTKLLDCVLNG